MLKVSDPSFISDCRLRGYFYTEHFVFGLATKHVKATPCSVLCSLRVIFMQKKNNQLNREKHQLWLNRLFLGHLLPSASHTVN